MTDHIKLINEVRDVYCFGVNLASAVGCCCCCELELLEPFLAILRGISLVRSEGVDVDLMK